MVAAQKLEQLPNNINQITREQIVTLTEPLIDFSSPEEMMTLAKDTSRNLFKDTEPNERVVIINNLVSRNNYWLSSCKFFIVYFHLFYIVIKVTACPRQ